MNAMNRGSLRAIKTMLEKIDSILIDICNSEASKECGGNGGAPIEAQHGETSSQLSSISDMLEDVISELDDLVPDECDWE